MSKVIAGLSAEKSAGGGGERRSAGSEWVVLAALGVAFAVVSLADIALTFYPLGFGSAEWEFSTATAVMNNLPLGIVGIAFLGVAGIGRRSRSMAAAAQAVAVLLIVLVLGMAFFFARNLGVATASVEDPVLRQGLSESIIRTAVQLVAYLVAVTWLVIGIKKQA